MKHEVAKKFFAGKGMIMPIRAAMLRHKRGADCSEIVEEMLGIMKNGKENAIIGYFAAGPDFDPDQPQMTCGISIINPNDYRPEIDLNVSKIRAISLAMRGLTFDENQKLKTKIPSQALKRCNYDIGEPGTCTYIYIRTIREQFDQFVATVKRHFAD